MVFKMFFNALIKVGFAELRLKFLFRGTSRERTNRYHVSRAKRDFFHIQIQLGIHQNARRETPEDHIAVKEH